MSKPSTANMLTIEEDPDKTPEQQFAEVALSGLVTNANTARSYAEGTFGELDLNAAIHVLHMQADKVQAGDISSVESMLTAQAIALDAMFNELARRALQGNSPSSAELYLRLAFKAQNQCRNTLATLVEIRFPQQVAIVQHANIAHGPQQINHHAPAPPARARKNTQRENELLEGAQHGKRLDTRAQGTASATDPAMATVAPVHRPAQRRRQTAQRG